MHQNKKNPTKLHTDTVFRVYTKIQNRNTQKLKKKNTKIHTDTVFRVFIYLFKNIFIQGRLVSNRLLFYPSALLKHTM